MATDKKKIAQLLRVYKEMSLYDQQTVYELIRTHLSERDENRQVRILDEVMTKHGVYLGPATGGCPRCGYPN